MCVCVAQMHYYETSIKDLLGKEWISALKAAVRNEDERVIEIHSKKVPKLLGQRNVSKGDASEGRDGVYFESDDNTEKMVLAKTEDGKQRVYPYGMMVSKEAKYRYGFTVKKRIGLKTIVTKVNPPDGMGMCMDIDVKLSILSKGWTRYVKTGQYSEVMVTHRQDLLGIVDSVVLPMHFFGRKFHYDGKVETNSFCIVAFFPDHVCLISISNTDQHVQEEKKSMEFVASMHLSLTCLSYSEPASLATLERFLDAKIEWGNKKSSQMIMDEFLKETSHEYELRGYKLLPEKEAKGCTICARCDKPLFE